MLKGPNDRERQVGLATHERTATLSACLAFTLRVEAQPGRTAEVRDPYARWCGRGGAVRRPPIWISDPNRTSFTRVHGDAALGFMVTRDI